MSSEPLFTFPRWANRVTIAVLAGVVLLPAYLGALLIYGGNPTTLNVGYTPHQPVAYSHALHAGKLGIDCRYCHWTVENAATAALPPTEVCMKCHAAIFPNSPKLAEVRRSHADGSPIPWIKVHDLPDYVFFDHSAHLNAGVGCVECHGRVNQMEEVRQVQPLNMAWCLECHRRPEPLLRPKDQLTNMDWSPAGQGQGRGQKDARSREALGKELRDRYHVNPNTDCVTCHR